MTGEFPAQRASNVEDVSFGWRHHDFLTRYQKQFSTTWCQTRHTRMIAKVIGALVHNLTIKKTIYQIAWNIKYHSV